MSINELFVPYGDYDLLKKIYETDLFFNVLVSGPKGCGKTQAILHIHDTLEKPVHRVNITVESDEDSLMGGFRLAGGETYFDKGPVIKAMEEGATLLLDEVDLGHPMKLLCLQSVLEGHGYLIKKTKEWVKPKEGFKIIATANTKGSGDDTGSYVGTQVLNAAMLDRIDAFFDWDYPDETTERVILTKLSDSLQANMTEDNIKQLVNWARHIRHENTYENTETISTRKLCAIVKCFKIYENIDKAIDLCINGYTDDRIYAYRTLYDSLSPEDETRVKINKNKFDEFFNSKDFLTT